MFNRFWSAMVAAVLLFWSGGTAMAEPSHLSGSVTYLNRSALPPGAVLDVELVDISRADAPSIRLSSQRFAIDRVPFPFQLAYDASLIDQRFRYTVQARISLDGQVLYRNTTAYPALTADSPETIEIVVDQMPSPAAQGLQGSDWTVDELAGRLLVVDKLPTIRFLPDGQASVSAGCNRFNGGVEISGAAMRFSDRMAGTMMACPPPYDTLERDFLKVLAEVDGFVQTGDRLALTNAAGVTVMRLGRGN